MPPREPVLLDLGDGLPPIPCRDAAQAALYLRMWLAYVGYCQRAAMGLHGPVDDSPGDLRATLDIGAIHGGPIRAREAPISSGLMIP